jgi:hypothetical protein
MPVFLFFIYDTTSANEFRWSFLLGGLLQIVGII